MTESTPFRRVLDLIGQDVAGQRAQIRQRYDWSDWRPVWRTLRRVDQIDGMVYLRWEPENGSKDMGYVDCGYSGRGVELCENWTIEMEDK